jgi:hypothetical protein
MLSNSFPRSLSSPPAHSITVGATPLPRPTSNARHPPLPLSSTALAMLDGRKTHPSHCFPTAPPPSYVSKTTTAVPCSTFAKRPSTTATSSSRFLYISMSQGHAIALPISSHPPLPLPAASVSLLSRYIPCLPATSRHVSRYANHILSLLRK